MELTTAPVTETGYSDEFMIYSRLFKADDFIIAKRQELLSAFNVDNVFKQEYHVFHLIVKQVGLKVSQISKSYLQTFLKMQKAYLSHNPNIDLNAYAPSDDPYVDFSLSVLTYYDMCIQTPVTDDAYTLAIEGYKLSYINMAALTMLQTATNILCEGQKIGRQLLSGYNDMKSYLFNSLTKIDNVENTTHHRGCVVYGVDDEADCDKKPLRKICSLGIKALDTIGVGLYEKQIMNIVAPSKVGKSRFCIQVAVLACLAGANVAIWSMENGFEGAENMFRSRLFYERYFKAKGKIVTGFDDSRLMKGDLSKELKDLESACWLDFKEKSKRGLVGRFANIDEPFTADNYLQVIDRYSKLHNIDLWIIDYFGLLGAGEGKSSDNRSQRVSDAYIETKNYMNGQNFALIAPAQFKQDKYDLFAGKSKEELAKTDFQTIGGISYEIFKTADINMCLFATQTDRDNGEATIYSMPSRYLAPFKPIPLATNMGVCALES